MLLLRQRLSRDLNWNVEWWSNSCTSFIAHFPVPWFSPQPSAAVAESWRLVCRDWGRYEKDSPHKVRCIEGIYDDDQWIGHCEVCVCVWLARPPTCTWASVVSCHRVAGYIWNCYTYFHLYCSWGSCWEREFQQNYAQKFGSCSLTATH